MLLLGEQEEAMTWKQKKRNLNIPVPFCSQDCSDTECLCVCMSRRVPAVWLCRGV